MDEQGNLQPGDEGYVAPIDAVQGDNTQQGLVDGTRIENASPNYHNGEHNPTLNTVDNTPLVENNIPAAGVVGEPVANGTPEKTLTSAEAGSLHLQGHRFGEPVEVTQDAYNRLLSAYNSLKQRSALDPHIEKQLDAQAGLI